MNAVVRHVGGLVIHPEPFPFQFDLPKVFGMIQQLQHPTIGIGGVLVKKTASIVQNTAGDEQEENPTHVPPHRSVNAFLVRRPDRGVELREWARPAT